MGLCGCDGDKVDTYKYVIGWYLNIHNVDLAKPKTGSPGPGWILSWDFILKVAVRFLFTLCGLLS